MTGVRCTGRKGRGAKRLLCLHGLGADHLLPVDVGEGLPALLAHAEALRGSRVGVRRGARGEPAMGEVLRGFELLGGGGP